MRAWRRAGAILLARFVGEDFSRIIGRQRVRIARGRVYVLH